MEYEKQVQKIFSSPFLLTVLNLAWILKFSGSKEEKW